MKSVKRLVMKGFVLLFMLSVALGQDLADRVTKYELDNGMRVIFVEQKAAPVIAFNMMFDVGGIDEPDGLGGVAHMVEHMAFKGTRSFGSLDLEAELNAIAAVEVEKLALEWLKKNGTEDEIAAQEERFAAAQAEAQALAMASPLDDLFAANGGVGLNATTAADRTAYTVELPANRLELYARVYADILAEPVFRYFYEERDVVREERRQRNEDDPQGVLFEAFLSEAFQVSPYGRSLIGPAEEIEGYTASAAQAIFDLFYHPNRIVLVMVGDVNPEEDIQVIERYFGAVESAPPFRPVIAKEPEQTEERRVVVTYDAEPQIAIGYHKPTYPHRDAYVLDLADAILSSGRTSRLFKRMILEEQIALDIFTSSSFPGTREDNLFVFYGLPQAPSTPDDLEAVFYEELSRLQSELVSPEELQKVKNQVRANTIRSLASNSGLASSLAYHELFAGGWEALIDDLEIYDSITAEEIRTVMNTYFSPTNRTVAVLLNEGESQ